jgi:hypothetical protein
MGCDFTSQDNLLRTFRDDVVASFSGLAKPKERNSLDINKSKFCYVWLKDI